jgi:hypothetical protein
MKEARLGMPICITSNTFFFQQYNISPPCCRKDAVLTNIEWAYTLVCVLVCSEQNGHVIMELSSFVKSNVIKIVLHTKYCRF